MNKETKIVFLHHSTGNCIWKGGVPEWLAEYNAANGVSYSAVEQAFPKKEPYGWNNYPYDYWNIWVNNAGDEPFQDELTLEMLTRDYDVIIWKHCFPVSSIKPDTGSPDIASPVKSLENYKLQYAALKEKMRSFPDAQFIVWTPAALVESKTDAVAAERVREFTKWLIEEWDEPGDNIFLWDFYALETAGGLYVPEANAGSPTDSHPNKEFSAKAAPSFAQRIVDVIEGRGDEGPIC
jgi:hypothetical protein